MASQIPSHIYLTYPSENWIFCYCIGQSWITRRKQNYAQSFKNQKKVRIIIFLPGAEGASSTPTSFTFQTNAIFEITVFRGSTQINITAMKLGQDFPYWPGLLPVSSTTKFLVVNMRKRAGQSRNILVTHREGCLLHWFLKPYESGNGYELMHDSVM